MKRLDLLRHLEAHGCRFVREGGSHTVYINPVARKVSAIPRHREINEFLASKICKDLDVPSPKA
ncbi:type II toxin-antitoxin system HicA family toxin [Methylocaldum gracile]|uniref:type II toxin-antitoxin system HicA family toxin n=1 Tax=unclassified Methylocaldum TaxID=2622260 RepID=UPI00105BCF97